jgi:hypothetical protein
MLAIIVMPAMCIAGAVSAAFLSDLRGTAALLSQRLEPRSNGPSILDSLSGEEVALGSATLLQGEIIQSVVTGPKSYSIKIDRLLFAVSESNSPNVSTIYKVLDAGPFVLPVGSHPVLSLHPSPARVDGHNLGVAQGVPASVGYVVGGVLRYRSANGTERYSLSPDGTLFSCLSRAALTGASCRRNRLRAFGIQTALQQSIFDSLTSRDPLATKLWFLIRRRDSKAIFPSRSCARGVPVSSDCASSRTFGHRLNFLPAA